MPACSMTQECRGTSACLSDHNIPGALPRCIVSQRSLSYRPMTALTTLIPSHHHISSLRFAGSAAHRPQVGVAFGMDANTGRLLPGQHGPSSQESGGSDLLETPALATLPSQGRPGPGPSRLRMATQQSSGDEQPEVSEFLRKTPFTVLSVSYRKLCRQMIVA